MSEHLIHHLALPPLQNVSAELDRLAEVVTARIAPILQQSGGALPTELREQVLACLRLLSPYGEVTSLGAQCPGQNALLLPIVAGHLVEKTDEGRALVAALDLALRHPEVVTQFPTLTTAPQRNDNALWETHARLLTAPVYDLLAADLQVGLVHLLERSKWKRTPKAQAVLDARLTGPCRIVPLLDYEPLAVALAQADAQGCGEQLWQVAQALNHVHTGAALDEKTRAGYFVDACRLLHHSEWAAAHPLDTTLGYGDESNHRWSEAQLLREEDDPPETSLLPDGFRESTLEAVESRVRRVLSPGQSLEMIEVEDAPQHFNFYQEEIAVMREFHDPTAWNCAHPTELAGALASFVRPGPIFQKYDDRRLAIATLTLSVALTGRPARWLLRVRAGEWNELQSHPELARRPRYAPELDALVYIPEAIPQIPTHPQRTADLFEPVSPLWILPLPAVLIPWWRELHRRHPREELFQIDLAIWKEGLGKLTAEIRKDHPRRPALTEGRLRSAYTALFENKGGLDPMLAAFISEQWGPSLRVPLFYSTVTLANLAERYRAASQKVWDYLRILEPRLPSFDIEPRPLPTVRFGSPYLPRLEVLRQVVAALQSAIDQAGNEEARHNARLLKLLYGLAIFCGLRISEAGTLAATQVDLGVRWQGRKLPWLIMPETRGNRWTTAARIVPLPEALQTLTRELLSESIKGPAFYFMKNGQPQKASAAAIREALARLSVPLPRWHAGRHYVRSRSLEEGLCFSAINAVLGHQSAGQELFNPYRPDDPGEYWRAYVQFARRLAEEVGWREGP